MSRSSLFRAVLAVALAAVSLPASAGMFDALNDVKQPDFRYGPVEAHPYFRYAEVYDSNIFLQPSSPSKNGGQTANAGADGPVLGSFIHTLGLGFKSAAALSEMHRLDFAYDMAYKAYTKDPGNNNTVNQGVDAMYSYKGPAGLAGHFRDTYINTVDPATSEQTKRTRRWANTLGIDGEYAPEGGNLSFGLDANQTNHKYVSDPGLGSLLNRYEQLFGFKAGYKVMPQTRAYVAYHHQMIHYSAHPMSPTKNNKGELVDFGVEGQIAPKLTGQIQTGLQYRKYDDAPFAGAKKTTRNWMLATKLDYAPLERTKVGVALSRSLQESSFGNSQYYVASAASLNVKHSLPYKLTAGFNTAFESDKYSEAVVVANVNGALQRRDDLYQVGFSLDYDIQSWLKAGLSYLYRTRFSKNASEQFNYNDNLLGVTFGVTF